MRLYYTLSRPNRHLSWIPLVRRAASEISRDDGCESLDACDVPETLQRNALAQGDSEERTALVKDDFYGLPKQREARGLYAVRSDSYVIKRTRSFSGI